MHTVTIERTVVLTDTDLSSLLLRAGHHLADEKEKRYTVKPPNVSGPVRQPLGGKWAMTIHTHGTESH